MKLLRIFVLIIVAAVFFLLPLMLGGCVVTGSVEYQDPEHPEISGRIGVTQNFDGKTLKPLRGLSK